MNKTRAFVSAFLEAIKAQFVYWALAFGIGCLNIAIGSEAVDLALTMVCLYLGIGAYVVFVKFKEPRVPCSKAFDFKAALSNIYRAAWWPWYALSSKRGRK